MRLGSGAAFLFFAPVVLAACSALFEDPVQCATDGDCARFPGTVCGAQGTCQSSSALGPNGSVIPGGSGGPNAPGDDGGATSPASTSPNTTTPPPNQDCLPVGSRVDTGVPGTPAADGGTGTDITLDTTLGCHDSYVLTGAVVVQPGVTLTIKPGAVIKGQAGAGLYVLPGAKIVAVGAKDNPIVFTSGAATKKVGDWRGLFVLGKAPGNGTVQGAGFTYGGNDENDSSGQLQYVRVEYAGLGLQLDAVGNGTKVDHVQARKTGDNGITIAGGRVDLKYVAVQYPADEMFEFNSGYQGRAQFLIGQRTPTTGANHHGLMLDNAKLTASNVTLCGADVADQGTGLIVRNGSSPQLSSLIVSGFDAGFDVVGGRGDPFTVTNTVFHDNRGANVAYAEGGSTDTASPLFDDDMGFDEQAFALDAATKNSEADPGLGQCYDPNAPGFVPGSPVTTDPPPGDAFFDATATYAGAIKDAAGDWSKEPWLVWSAN